MDGIDWSLEGWKMFNSLPNDTFLDGSKFKALTDDKINVKKKEICFGKGRKHCGKSRNAGYQHFLLFSSPEHKVLMVSFCDRPMSGVCRPSCVIHNFFKHLLLNHWANLDETWQGCSLGEALPKLFKRLNSNHNSGCHGNQKEKNSKIFENLLL